MSEKGLLSAVRCSAGNTLCLSIVLAFAATLFVGGSSVSADDPSLKEELKRVPYKIVFETYRNDNWELFMCNADGSNLVNLTKTPKVHELYPHASPDGKKIVFCVDSGEGRSRTRSVYYMNIDGTGRKLVAHKARQPCWGPTANLIAYLLQEHERFSLKDFATRSLMIYNLRTGKHRQHPNPKLEHLYNICWSPDGKWFLATVHAGMGYRHAILAIEANGTRVVNLKISGCRPDISPDGKRITWGRSDWHLSVGELDFSGPVPKVINARDVVVSKKPIKVYHSDWSPDGRYIAYSRGPVNKHLGVVDEMVGVYAKGWDICVADASKTNRCLTITADGLSNKEPDWVPVEAGE